MKPGSKKSEVCNYFKKEESGNFVSCPVCKRKFLFFGNTNNSNFHLKRLHRTMFNYLQPVNSSGMQFFPPSTSVQKGLTE